MKITEHAYAKVNLALRVGSPQAGGLHPLCSIFASVRLADVVTVDEAAENRLLCPGVEGRNLAAEAVAAFRAVVPDLPPLEVTIEKRIPVAAGMGGGSADAAAVLRAANELSGGRLDADELRRLGAGLGSDVPSQVEPRHALVWGAGEKVAPLRLPRIAFVLLPQADGLSTARVFEELDRLRAEGAAPGASALDPEALRRLAAAPLAELARGLENDLGPAAISLRPDIEAALESLLGAGALAAQVTGSGPTTFGVFEDRFGADLAASRLSGAIVTETRGP